MRVWLHRLALGALLLGALLLPHPPGGTALSPPQSSAGLHRKNPVAPPRPQGYTILSDSRQRH